MLKSPDHRFLDLKKRIEGGTAVRGDVEAALKLLVSGKDCKHLETAKAYAIHTREFKREALEALLLAGIDAETIEQVVRVPVPVTEIYMEYFFDVAVFEDDLDIIDYAHGYDKSEYGKDLKCLAADLGSETIKIKLSRGSYTVNPLKVKEEIRNTAFLLAQHAKVNPMKSDVSRAAHKWATLAVRAADEDTSRDERDIDKILIELDTQDETTDEEKSGIVKEDILH